MVVAGDGVVTRLERWDDPEREPQVEAPLERGEEREGVEPPVSTRVRIGLEYKYKYKLRYKYKYT